MYLEFCMSFFPTSQAPLGRKVSFPYVPIPLVLTTLFQGLRWHLGKGRTCILRPLCPGLSLRAVGPWLQLTLLERLNCLEGPGVFRAQLQSLHTESKLPTVRSIWSLPWDRIVILSMNVLHWVNRFLRSKEGFNTIRKLPD